MDWGLLSYRAKSWLKFQLTAWNTGGEGVHSPYLFEWVRMVMSDKHRYYVWKDIEVCRAELLRDQRVLEQAEERSPLQEFVFIPVPVLSPSTEEISVITLVLRP